MKRYIWLIAVAVTIGFFLNSYEQRVVFGQAADAATVTMKGEVVDMHCFVTRHGGEGRGASHAGCANACLARNVTAGFVASDGKVYLLFDEKPFPVKEKIAGLAGQAVTLTGAVVERDGVRGILLKSINPAQ
ncbi:MAG TPA: hypothetical protein VN937_02960 [Blastocatellia bacterium]|nr:hypothetical protein [Blastocatellia bacterium]